MTPFPQLTDEFRLKRLTPPTGLSEMVLDTDTFNEVDDQFALAYAMLSPEAVHLQAIYAAPFHNSRSNGPEDGMVKSYEEIQRILAKIGPVPESFVFEGSRQWMKDSQGPVDSPAARDLVAKAMAMPDDKPLYVLSIGAPTNISSALLMEPEIIQKIVIVWLGGHPHNWRDTKEFNLRQDYPSSALLFDSGVPLVQIPCINVAEHLRVSIPFLKEYLAGHSELGDYLTEIVSHYPPEDPFCWSKPLWDISTVAWMCNPLWCESELVSTPILTSNLTYSHDGQRPLMRVITHLKTVAIYKDIFAKIGHLGYKAK